MRGDSHIPRLLGADPSPHLVTLASAGRGLTAPWQRRAQPRRSTDGRPQGRRQREERGWSRTGSHRPSSGPGVLSPTRRPCRPGPCTLGDTGTAGT